MNPIQRLQHDISEAHPGTSTTLDQPLREGGAWSLCIGVGDKRFVVEWSETIGFGISSVDFESFGEAPDEHFESLHEARQRVQELLTNGQATAPPIGVLLSRLRAQRGMTQKELAHRLQVTQATISGVEGRKDMQLSTLFRCIEALEGRIEIYATFADARYRIDTSSPFSSPLPRVSREAPCRTRRPAHCDFAGLRKAGRLRQATQFATEISTQHAVIRMP